MTRFHQTTCSALSRPRRLVAVAMAATVGVVGLAVDATDAAPRTKSTIVAGEADEAAAALDRWHETQNPIDYVLFVQHRDQAAELAAAEVDLPVGALRDAWERVDLAKQAALLNAVSQLGVPYRNLASEPGVGFDCSGLTVWAFGAAGMEISRISRHQINEADQIDRAEAEAGDLVYYPGHVSIYLGADMMVHSPNSGSHVEITDLPDKSLRFGDAASAQRAASVETGSLMDRALAVTE